MIHNGTNFVVASQNGVRWSSDGLTWNMPTGTRAPICNDIAYDPNNGRIVAAGGNLEFIRRQRSELVCNYSQYLSQLTSTMFTIASGVTVGLLLLHFRLDTLYSSNGG